MDRRNLIASALILVTLFALVKAQLGQKDVPASAPRPITPVSTDPSRPVATLTLTATDALPDLVIDRKTTFTIDTNGDCIWDYIQLQTICIKNQGTGDVTPPFMVEAGEVHWIMNELEAGATVCLKSGSLIHTAAIIIDPDDQVIEWNEVNNVIPLPTPPVPMVCTSTPDDGTAQP